MDVNSSDFWSRFEVPSKISIGTLGVRAAGVVLAMSLGGQPLKAPMSRRRLGSTQRAVARTYDAWLGVILVAFLGVACDPEELLRVSVAESPQGLVLEARSCRGGKSLALHDIGVYEVPGLNTTCDVTLGVPPSRQRL